PPRPPPPRTRIAALMDTSGATFKIVQPRRASPRLVLRRERGHEVPRNPCFVGRWGDFAAPAPIFRGLRPPSSSTERDIATVQGYVKVGGGGVVAPRSH